MFLGIVAKVPQRDILCQCCPICLLGYSEFVSCFLDNEHSQFIYNFPFSNHRYFLATWQFTKETRLHATLFVLLNISNGPLTVTVEDQSI